MRLWDQKRNLQLLWDEQVRLHSTIVFKEKQSSMLEDQNEALTAAQIEGIMLVETVKTIQWEIAEMKSNTLLERLDQIHQIYEENKRLKEQLKAVKQRAQEIMR